MTDSRTEPRVPDSGSFPRKPPAVEGDDERTPPDASGPRDAEDVSSSQPPSAALSFDLTERTLGEFLLLRRLGRGGMADVYLAEQKSLRRHVAVKVLRGDLVGEANPTFLRRFEQEAKAAAALVHPHIVQVHTIGETEGLHYIAQEYVHGGNLREYLQRHGAPDAATAVSLMRDVAAALQAAGEAGIVHRDVKPENILVTRKGEAKVADFGLAQLSQVADGGRLTQVGMTMGTPLYMSPEQINGRPLDARSDLYSFGVTFYHLLAGKPPFRGETALAIAVQHLHESPPDLATVRPDLPAALCEVVRRLMAKSPDDRPPDARTVRAELDRIAQSLAADGSGAATMSATSSAPAHRAAADPSARSGVRGSEGAARASHRLLRSATLFAAACVLVAGASAAVGWRFRPGDPFAAPLPAREDRIPRRDTAAEQVLLALELVDDEAAWKAVGEYFPGPESARERQRAREQLAILYLRSRRFDEARTLYREFSIRGEHDPPLKARGLAGLAALASLDGDYAESQRLITVELLPLRGDLDTTSERLVRETIARNRRHLGDQVKQDLEQVFERPAP